MELPDGSSCTTELEVPEVGSSSRCVVWSAVPSCGCPADCSSQLLPDCVAVLLLSSALSEVEVERERAGVLRLVAAGGLHSCMPESTDAATIVSVFVSDALRSTDAASSVWQSNTICLAWFSFCSALSC